MVKLCGVPPQLLAVGVTVTVAISAAAVLLIAVKDDISPVPLVARPIDELEFVQL